MKMTDKPNNFRRIECRLVLIERDSMRIVTTASAEGSTLPRESIPACVRTAEALTDAMEQKYGLHTIQLAFLPGSEALSCCAIHEIMGSQEEERGILSFKTMNEIAPSELTETERATVRKIIKREAPELGRFARIGWIDELLAKTGSHRSPGSIPVIRQLNQGNDFCLLSLTDSTGRKMWFKAVGEPNTRDWAPTILGSANTKRMPPLAKKCPHDEGDRGAKFQYMPAPLHGCYSVY
jgi:hypothetical protein